MRPARAVIVQYAPTLEGEELRHHENQVREIVGEILGARVVFEYIEVEQRHWKRSRVRLTGWWSLSRAEVLDVLAACWLDVGDTD